MQTFGKSFYLWKCAEAPYRSSRVVWLWKNLYFLNPHFHECRTARPAWHYCLFLILPCCASGLPWCSLGTAEMKPPAALFSPLLENCHYAPLLPSSSEQATTRHYPLHTTMNDQDATSQPEEWRILPSRHLGQRKNLCFQLKSTIWAKLWMYRLSQWGSWLLHIHSLAKSSPTFPSQW